MALCITLFAYLPFAETKDRTPTLSISPAAATAGAKLYDGAVTPDLYVGTVKAAELLDLMRSAAWTNDRLMRKGAWVLELSDSTRICVSYYGDFFWVGGTPGYFVVAKHLQAPYRKLVESRLHEPTVQWRMQRNAANQRSVVREPAGKACSNA